MLRTSLVTCISALRLAMRSFSPPHWALFSLTLASHHNPRDILSVTLSLGTVACIQSHNTHNPIGYALLLSAHQ